MTFDQLNLDTRILKAINLCGYSTPTPIQAQSIPKILSGSDLVASAQTGTGKTAAFVLPILQKICQMRQIKKETNTRNAKSLGGSAKVLILTPTRELANQITKNILQYSKFLSVSVGHVIGGTSYHQQIRDLNRGVDILVATPGRLLDHIRQKRTRLKSVDVLVLDEADRMLDMGFIDDVKLIGQELGAERQTLLFSATIDKQLNGVIKQLLNNPTTVALSPEKLAPGKIDQSVYYSDNLKHKIAIFNHLITEQPIFKGIIFSATKINAEKLSEQLVMKGLRAAALHGDMKQNKRNRVIEQLRSGRIQFLVATDVAARGIDISDVSHVFNFDLPRNCEDYIHRIGRTGRAGKTGSAISLVSVDDRRSLQRIERYMQQTLKLGELPAELKSKQNVLTSQQPHKAKRSSSKQNRSYQNGQGKPRNQSQRKIRTSKPAGTAKNQPASISTTKPRKSGKKTANHKVTKDRHRTSSFKKIANA